MARGKGKKSKKDNFDSDDEDTAAAASTVTNNTNEDEPGLSRKQKRQQKLKGKQQGQQQQSQENVSEQAGGKGDGKRKNKKGGKRNAFDSDDENDDDVPKNVQAMNGGDSSEEEQKPKLKKLTKKQLMQQKGREAAEARAKAEAEAMDEDEDKDESEEEDIPQPAKKLTKKQLKKQKEREAAEARAEAAMEEDEDESDEEEAPQPVKKLTKKQLKKQKEKEAAEARANAEVEAMEEEEDESEEEEIPQPAKKLTKKQLKKQKEREAAEAEAESAMKEDDEEDGEEDESEEEEEVPQPTKKLTKKQLKKQKEKEAVEARAKAEANTAMEEDEDVSEEEEEVPQPTKKLTKKQLKKQKEKEAAAARTKAEEAAMEEDEEEDESEEEVPQPAKNLSKKQLKKLKEKEEAERAAKEDLFGASSSEEEEEKAPVSGFSSLDADDEEEEEEEDKAITSNFAMMSVDDDDDEEDEDKNEKEKTIKFADEEEEKEKKAKKAARKAEKEAKKAEKVARRAEKETRRAEKEVRRAEKEAKRAAKENADVPLTDSIPTDNVANGDDNGAHDISSSKESSNPVEKKPKKKSKLELQMEAAMAKKKEMEENEEPTEEAQKEKMITKEERKKSKFELQIEAALAKKKREDGIAKAAAEAKQEVGDKKPMSKAERKQKKKEMEIEKKEKEEAKAKNEGVEEKSEIKKEESDEVFYGAPDDHAWTDKSAAVKAADDEVDTGPDRSLTHSADGKKLSNKQRKLLLKAKQAAERAAEYEAHAVKASAEGAQFACSQTAINEKDPQWQNSLDINIPSFSISAAGKILFKDAVFNIAHGSRYGLVGPNGKGKSTLLKMIASQDLKLPPRVDFLYVEQEVAADDTPAIDAVMKADKVRWDLLQEESTLTKEIDAGDESAKKIERLQQVYEELNQMGAEAAESKARRILYGLGFDMDMQVKPTKMFSGGWRMRISLARALFIEPTLLMLDEPTNHLDLNAVIWLDDYLQKWKKTLLVVSHDQDFLNSVCREILHIEDLKLVSYKGNYDSFKKAERIKMKQQEKNWEKQQKRLRELKRSGKVSKEKATETVKNRREPGARAAKKKESDKIASGTATAKIAELIKRPKEYAVKLHFSEVAELSRPVMEVSNVHFRYSTKHPIIFNKIDFGIDMDSRICIVGPNGAGKSTLLKLLTGEIEATKGGVRRNARLRMGVYNQHFVDRLPMNKTPIEHLRDQFQDEDYQSVRNRLGKYGLEGHAHEVIMRDLSGGQKARVVFVELSLQKPHILLLDEPTNNLDIETIDALTEAINQFNGGVIVVTHDQRLIEECETNLWVVEKQGVTPWTAGFDDYKETLLKEMEEAVERAAEERKQKLEVAAVARAEKIARFAAVKLR